MIFSAKNRRDTSTTDKLRTTVAEERKAQTKKVNLSFSKLFDLMDEALKDLQSRKTVELPSASRDEQ
jgi:hypothetical protein